MALTRAGQVLWPDYPAWFSRFCVQAWSDRAWWMLDLMVCAVAILIAWIAGSGFCWSVIRPVLFCYQSILDSQDDRPQHRTAQCPSSSPEPSRHRPHQNTETDTTTEPGTEQGSGITKHRTIISGHIHYYLLSTIHNRYYRTLQTLYLTGHTNTEPSLKQVSLSNLDG